MVKNFLFSIIILSVGSVSQIFGCSLALKFLKDFDPREYVFVGEIVGYTEPLQFQGRENFSSNVSSQRIAIKQASGLMVKVKEPVYIPKDPKTHFELFPFSLSSVCMPLGVQIWELEQRFPIKSEVLVIAKEASIFSSDLPQGNLRLENRPAGNGVISLNHNHENQRLSWANSVFDYKKLNTDKLFNQYNVIAFEVRKDLIRLKNSKTQTGRNEILNRLFYLPLTEFPNLDFYALFTKYLKSVEEAESLFVKKLENEGWSKEKIQETLKYYREKSKSKK